jgi:tight adherence protein B
MTAVLLAITAGAGAHLLYTATALGWRGLGPAGARLRTRRGASWREGAGLADVDLSQLAAVTAVTVALVSAVTFVVFGAPMAALAVGGASAAAPIASQRSRQKAKRAAAQDAWPRMIEEVRILTSSLGRSIPQAVLEVGLRGPAELRPAFDAARREWLISTSFERATTVLKAGLADPTADAACETLLIAHEVGGNDLDRRLLALAEDRVVDAQGRKDARAKQAGVRFARRFVLIVPIGMAVAGMSVGDGRDAYRSPSGQLLVVVGIAVVILCWVWAGALMRLPAERRVFSG